MWRFYSDVDHSDLHLHSSLSCINLNPPPGRCLTGTIFVAGLNAQQLKRRQQTHWFLICIRGRRVCAQPGSRLRD